MRLQARVTRYPMVHLTAGILLLRLFVFVAEQVPGLRHLMSTSNVAHSRLSLIGLVYGGGMIFALVLWNGDWDRWDRLMTATWVPQMPAGVRTMTAADRYGRTSTRYRDLDPEARLWVRPLTTAALGRAPTGNDFLLPCWPWHLQLDGAGTWHAYRGRYAFRGPVGTWTSITNGRRRDYWGPRLPPTPQVWAVRAGCGYLRRMVGSHPNGPNVIVEDFLHQHGLAWLG